MRHFVYMLIGCVLPFMLIFVLSLFGIADGVTMLVFVVLMFSYHLFMMRGHQHGTDNIEGQDRKGEDDSHS